MRVRDALEYGKLGYRYNDTHAFVRYELELHVKSFDHTHIPFGAVESPFRAYEQNTDPRMERPKENNSLLGLLIQELLWIVVLLIE